MALTGLLDNATLAAVPGSPGQRLRADAAEAWGRVVAALLLRGIVLHLTDSYRPLSVQTIIFLARYSRSYAEYAPGKIDCRIWNGTPYWRTRGQAAAAIPGTSNHGRALAVDCSVGSFTSDAYRALLEVGPRNGWTNVEGIGVREPWHWVYNPVLDAHPVSNTIGSIGKPVTTAPTLDPLMLLDPQEDDMPTIVNAGPAGTYLLDGGRMLGIDESTAAEARTNGCKTLTITRDRYLEWIVKDSKVALFRDERGNFAINVGRTEFSGITEMTDVDSLRAQGLPLYQISNKLWDRMVAGIA